MAEKAARPSCDSMNTLQLILLSLGLAMDAFAVSVASGIAIQNLRIHHALRIALAFGLFQAIMPVIGWLAGLALQKYVTGIDHWVAFGLLTFIGGKMIYEATRMEEAEEASNPLNLYVLLVLAIATSVDALAVGITFAMLGTAIMTPVVVIGSVTFVLCLAGVYIGDMFGHFFEKKIEIFGGVVLIGIGLKILLEHLLAR
jgi:putative Mn2+ efflux pump MntP